MRDSRIPVAFALATLCAAAAAQTPRFARPPIPLLEALDADRDETISATEIQGAPDALQSLDRDQSGHISGEELVPDFARRPPGPQGPQDGSGPPAAGRRGRGDPGGFLRRLPLMTALDSDSDGEISADERRAAPAALVGLDSNGSGGLEFEEIMPRFGGRGGPGQGRGLPGQGRGPDPRSIPVIAGLDRDGNGDLSPEEVSFAPASLRSMDSDANGTLSMAEMMPAEPDRQGRGRRGGAGPGGGPGGRGGPPGFGRGQLPLIGALDWDGSGDLTSEEISAAASSLATLDRDGSGGLEAVELAPALPGGMGLGRGPGGDAQAVDLMAPDEIDSEMGTAAIPDRETFEELSYQGREIMVDSGLIGLEFVKFIIAGAGTEEPAMYYQNTNRFRAHPQFMRTVGLGTRGRGGPESGLLRGVLVYRPMLTSPSGNPGLYTFEFQPRDAFPFETIKAAHDLLEETSPLLRGNLAYHPLAAAVPTYEREKDQYETAKLAVFLEEEAFKNISFLPLNQAAGYGRLRLMTLQERPTERDVVLYKTLPNELPRVAGVITEAWQTPLSHVNLRAVQDNVPNAYVRSASADPHIAALVGKPVFYKVTDSGYEIREASLAEVEEHFHEIRPDNSPELARNLSVKEIRPLSELGFEDSDSIGVKAANVAMLGRLDLPEGVVPEGFAIPFHFYDEFMRHNAFYKRAQAIASQPGFSTDGETRERGLKELRREIEDGDIPAWMADSLSALQGAFPKEQPIRLRSSTNNEDLPGFSGAGLYDSFTHRPDEGHIAKSVKQVYASLWNFRAYEEREFFRVDHLQAAMGVLVHPNYSGELANGVAVTEDIVYQTGSHGRPSTYYVNAQLGEDLVTNPDGESIPEEFLLSPRGTAFDRQIRSSNRVQEGRHLINDAHRDELRGYLRTVHSKFAELYGIKAGDQFAMEIEFKVTSDGQLAIKQARPWVFN